uniref:Uncharacterized protein n=1 Tax=Solanum lycopersicum TaxID=4081 RepID=A0A3Q7FHE6_SOLLC
MNWVEHYEKDPKAAMVGLLNMIFEIFKCFVFLMNESSFNHGEREALRSCLEALNFWAAEIWWKATLVSSTELEALGYSSDICNGSSFQTWMVMFEYSLLVNLKMLDDL